MALCQAVTGSVTGMEFGTVTGTEVDTMIGTGTGRLVRGKIGLSYVGPMWGRALKESGISISFKYLF